MEMRLPNDALAISPDDALSMTHQGSEQTNLAALQQFIQTLRGDASPSDPLDLPSPNEIAAARMRQAVVPAGGRQEGGATEALLDRVPGRSALREAVKGN
jgi:hypothetical protein